MPSSELPQDPSETFSIGRLFTTSLGHLALALLTVELLTGMQTFLAGTITPILAGELGGQHLYGVATAAAQVAVFLTMPLGAALLHRFPAGKLLAWVTPVTVLAATIGALSPTMWVYIASRALTGLAAGVVATASMGAIVTGLPPSWRRMVLAANNLMWLISAVVGPMYAAWASQVLSWRWAMVLYLPLLIAARWVIARQLAKQPPEEPKESKLPVVDAVVLATGVALLTLTSIGRWWGWAAGALGLVAVLAPFARLLPAGVVGLRRGARAALGLLALLSLLVFTADALAPILAHDVLHFSPVKLGWLLTSMSFCWSLVGLVAAARPAAARQFRVRGGIGLALIGAGVITMALTLAAHSDLGFIAGFAVLGTGMGLSFFDAMNVAFTPEDVDPLDARDSSSAAVLGQQILGATGMTIATSLISLNPGLGVPVLLALTVFVVPAGVALWRATA